MTAEPTARRRSRPLPVATPSSQGVDARGVLAFLDAVEAAPGIAPHSLTVVRHGRVVASGHWAPYTPDRVGLVYSLSKSFTVTAAGFAVAEGLLDLDATVLSYFPEFDADIADPRSRSMLVRHAAAMASGHERETMQRALALDDRELVRGFLLVPPDHEPGTVFAYNQPATYALAAIVQRVTGASLVEYLAPRLFEPLGIGEAVWEERPAGRAVGFSGLHVAADAIAKLGLLHLNGGAWEGRQLLPSAWVEQATRSHVSNGRPELPDDWQQGYGLQFWLSRHGYRGDGAYGQFCLVLPEQDAVVAITSETVGMQALLDLVWRHLLPALDAPDTLDQATHYDAELASRMADLALPPLPAGRPRDLSAWLGVEFAPEGGECAAQPSLVSVTVRGGGALTLTERGGGLTLVLPEADAPAWRTQRDGPPATAVTGGWPDEDTLTVQVAFLETPHRLVVTCALATRTFTARWITRPLKAGTLAGLHAPALD